ncbi:hypothetical protein O6H91_09G051600 [Diphasiastrum complanatum]|uniref:Uncharacterized protein n=1 Tax=Diphasiastrum complanatum TaxID=34168 RepID=A0ACC2CP08_DIPCM|nr:hypothetical protein O6H91_09G051600 [Diphasiastrum complanatum]
MPQNMHGYTRIPRPTDSLVLGKVIGDVLEMFVPTVDMAVSYGSKQVSNGCELRPSMIIATPDVQLSSRYDERCSYFTLVMTDPDAPSPSEPALREWVHWIVTDIPGASDATKGREIVPYAAPRPPIGIHRYVFTLFKHRSPNQIVAPHVRQNFSTRSFAQEHGLGMPVAAVYFHAQKETAGRRR